MVHGRQLWNHDYPFRILITVAVSGVRDVGRSASQPSCYDCITRSAAMSVEKIPPLSKTVAAAGFGSRFLWPL